VFLTNAIEQLFKSMTKTAALWFIGYDKQQQISHKYNVDFSSCSCNILLWHLTINVSTDYGT